MKHNTLQYPSVGGATSAATQAEVEGITSTTVYIPPGRQHFHPSTAKAWVSIDGTGTVGILASYNVTSITDNGLGDYTVNLTTSFSDTNYVMAGQRNVTSNYASVGYHTSGGTKATGTCRIACWDSGALGDADMCDVVFFGTF